MNANANDVVSNHIFISTKLVTGNWFQNHINWKQLFLVMMYTESTYRLFWQSFLLWNQLLIPLQLLWITITPLYHFFLFNILATLFLLQSFVQFHPGFFTSWLVGTQIFTSCHRRSFKRCNAFLCFWWIKAVNGVICSILCRNHLRK